MRNTISWDALAGWTLPALILGVGLLPPHVHPALTAPLCLAGLLLTLALLGAGRVPSPRPGTALALVTVCFLAALSTASALQPLRSIRILLVWFVGGLAFVAARSAAARPHRRRIVLSVVILAALLAALGLYQSAVAFPRAAPGEASVAAGVTEDQARMEEAVRARLRSGRAVGTLGLPALLASLLILGLPLAVAEAFASSGSARLAWWGAAALQAGALVATRSLGGAAALALGAGICALWWIEMKPRRRRFVVGLLVLVLLLAGAPRLLGPGEGSAAESLTLRAANWRAALSMIAFNPILGVGPDNYGVAFPRHRTWESNETQHAHNSYLEVAADLGLPMLPFLVAALVGLVGRVGTASGGSRARDPRERWRGRALALASLAWAIQNVGDFGAYVAATAIPFLAVAGLLFREVEGEGRDRRPPAAPAGIPLRVLLLAAALLAATISVPDAIACGHLEGAIRAGREAEHAAAARAARRAAAWNPFDPETHVTLARALVEEAVRLPVTSARRRSLLAEAIVEAEEAIRLDPHTANRRAALSMAKAAAGDGAGAYAAMAAAARLNPFRPRYGAERDALLQILTGQGMERDAGRGP